MSLFFKPLLDFIQVFVESQKYLCLFVGGHVENKILVKFCQEGTIDEKIDFYLGA